ncbi:putative nuclease HARBI1 [Temnothorax nylanderi]|uniref:putative nuclease HARBI1 n=1 Tax=Temnothorax nylanderi TaxID=102681 RepID=UPI003A839DAD
MALQMIHWPTEQELPLIKEQFKAMARIDGVIGALDGTYVPIKAPSKDAETYINRKMQYAITLQAICDANLKFTDCYTGYPSSVHDARIFRNSDIYHSIRQNPEKYFPHDEFILADKAYPTLKWCITPYMNRGNLRKQQEKFNTLLSQTRQTIERAFALLFGRFRRLKYLDMNGIDLIPGTILACCVLHNVCLDFGDDLIREYVQEGMDAIVENQQEQIIYESENEKRVGNERRDALCEELNRNDD